MTTGEAIPVLFIECKDEVIQLLDGVVNSQSTRRMSQNEFGEQFTDFNDGHFAAIVCDSTNGLDFPMEIGQTCRNQCPKTPIYCVNFTQANHQLKLCKKNGFNDAFMMPADRKIFVDAISKSLDPAALAKKAFKRVKVFDLKGDTKLGFDTFVYLPLNKKHIQFSSAKETFSQKKAEKLKTHQVGALFIEQKDTDQFFEYVANQFHSFDNNVSVTEKEEKVQEAVRGIFSDIFDQSDGADFTAGRELMDSTRKLISTYLTKDAGKDYFGQLLRLLGGQRLEYSHAADVATIAAMFGMSLGLKDIDDLALAGFLHDLSLAQFPLEHGVEIDPTWDEQAKATYTAHPQKSIELIKLKRIIVSPNVEKIIASHHEKFNGTGFPKGLNGDRIPEDTQVLSIADQFFYLTSPIEGQKRHTPKEAFEVIAGNGSVAPSLVGRLMKAVLPA